MAVVTAVAAKTNAAIHALTTGAMAKAVPRPVAPALKAVAPTVAHKVAAKTVATTMTSCHVTLIP